MNTPATIYATCWQDGCLGGIAMHLKYPTPDKAIEAAQSIAAKGAGQSLACPGNRANAGRSADRSYRATQYELTRPVRLIPNPGHRAGVFVCAER